MTKNGFITMNRKTTRGKGLKGKALDHFYTNRPDKMHSIVVHNDTESDHAAVEYNRHMKIEGCEEIYINSRKWENIDYDIINEKIKNVPNYIRALEENNPDNLAEYMIHQISSKLDEQEPLRKINITKIDKQKYSKELVMFIEEKNNLYKKVKDLNNQEDIIQLKNLKNRIRKEKKNEEINNGKRSFDKCNGDVKKEWIIAKDKLFGTQMRHPERLIENGKMVTGSKKVAAAFNRYFISKTRSIRNSLDPQKNDPMISYRKYVKSPQSKMKFKKINMMELKMMIQKMKKSNSTSFDKVSIKTIVKLQESIYPLLLRLINIVTETKKFPSILKITRIFPIKKSSEESALNPDNWRPINLISPFSKIIEKFWAKQIIEHLIKNKMLDECHQGGLPGRNSNMLVMDIHSKLAKIKMNKTHGALISMDQSGAFDVVSHPILEQKLLHIGLCEDSVQLIMSYFRERKQYVSLNTQESEILLTGEVGTGQGSVVSGLFYSIYILDMNSQFHNKPHINNSSYNRCKKW